MTFPDRWTGLIQRLEAGQPITRAEADRLLQLQALDFAKAGEDFVRSAIAREEQRTDELRKTLGER